MRKNLSNAEGKKIKTPKNRTNPFRKLITYLQGQKDAGWINTAFTRQFTLTWIVILIATIISIAQQALSQGHNLEPSYEGFNYLFFTILKSPIAVVASGLVVMTFYVSNYRARQQDETLALSRNQNNFANFFQHRTELKEVFEAFHKKASTHGTFRSIQVDYGKLYTQVY